MKNSEWLYKCLETAEFLYGIFPFEVLNRIEGNEDFYTISTRTHLFWKQYKSITMEVRLQF